MTDDQASLIRQLKGSLIDMALGDVKRAANGGAKMGAFILCSCYIDYLAGFRYGKQAKRSHYKDFVRLYLKKYDPESVYQDLRCGLVHNYSEGGTYAFIDNLPLLHFKPSGFGKTFINLENFISDIEEAADSYFEQLENSDELLILASKRMKLNSILGVKYYL